MRTWHFALIGLMIIPAWAEVARADLPGPGWLKRWSRRDRSYPPVVPVELPAPAQAEPTRLKLEIVCDPQAQTAHLEIPRSLLKEAKAAVETEVAPQPAYSMVGAGVGLALAFGCGGLWLVRRRPGLVRGLIGLAGLTLVLGGGSALLWARIPPPPPPLRSTDNPVTVQFMDAGNTIKLTVHPALLEGKSK
jgi:hypothetical protein